MAQPEGLNFIVPTDAARAVGRFRAEGPTGYRASNDDHAPLRATREEAVADYIEAANRKGT